MFGIDKCSYINIERGKKISLGMNLCLNDFQISELENGWMLQTPRSRWRYWIWKYTEQRTSNSRISKKSKENLELATIRS